MKACTLRPSDPAALAMMVACLAAPLAQGAQPREDAPAAPTPEVRRLADWAVASDDHQRLPFVVVDKKGAHAYVYDAAGTLRASAPVLLGSAIGDDSVPGIGERKLADVLPHERTTPAGRFVAEPGRNLQGEDIVWIDYDAAVSMHRVRANKASERRLERLATPTPADNRISYGCINVPAAFYDGHVVPALASGRAIVYVLPETKPTHAVFSATAGAPSAARRTGGERAGQ